MGSHGLTHASVREKHGLQKRREESALATLPSDIVHANDFLSY